MYQNDLIYDCGMFNGDDTAYYLHKGYRVVAVEANPQWAEDGRQRFADAIRDGRLTIVNVAIGPEEGVAKLVVHEQNKEWATLNEETAANWGETPTHTVEVRTARFRDILAEHGVPFYLKVDIERFDHYCLEDIDPADLPRYASFEAMSFRDLVTMHDKGFDAFKIIRQYDHTQVFYDPNDVKAAIKRRLADRPGLVKALGLPGMLRYKAGRLVRRKDADQEAATPDWVFPSGSAGPFGEETDGPWRWLERGGDELARL